MESKAFYAAEKFWDEFVAQDDPAQSWEQYEELDQTTATALEMFPALSILLRAFQKTEIEGEADDATE